MKQQRKKLVIGSILLMFVLLGFSFLFNRGYVPTGLDIFIFLLIIISAVYAFLKLIKNYKDAKEGIPVEDEMSTRILHKAGYQAFMISLYLWLGIFLFQNYFPDRETMLGTGILLSALVFMVNKSYLTKHYHENKN